MSTHSPTTLNSFISNEKYVNWFGTDMAIYYCRYDNELYDDNLFEKLGIKFPESLKTAVVKRRAEYLAGRYCAGKSLQRCGITDTLIATGKNRSPVWPGNIIGSISHCDSHAVAVAGGALAGIGVGIDIENIISMETISNIQSQVLNKDEIPVISDTDRNALLFTLVFSVKESFFKAAHPTVERYFGFDAVSLINIDLDARRLLLVINEPLSDKLVTGMLVEGSFHILSENNIVTFVKLDG